MIGTFTMFEIPTGNADKGLGVGRTWYKLPIWVQKSFGALAQLNPGRYGKVEIGEQQVESIGAAAAVPAPAPSSASAAAAGGGKATVSVAAAPVAAAPVVPDSIPFPHEQLLG